MPHATTAITILEKLLAEVGPAHMPYWICPNMVLTLAGARGYGDGIFWGSKNQAAAWQKEIDADLAALKRITNVYMAESGSTVSTMGEHGASYDLVLRDGFDHTLEETSILSFDPNSLKDRSPEAAMKALCAAVVAAQGKEFNEEETGHIAFGVLLGYPDVAILGSTRGGRTAQDPFAERTIEADIRGADYYICPQPVYDYPHHLAADPSVQAHEQLWSKILKDFYTSNFHKKLAQDSSFKAKLAELDQ
jgi:hypothetical protein